MRKRTKSREFALQILYQIDITSLNYQDVLDIFWKSHSEENIFEEVKKFTEDLVKGVVENLSEIDKKIAQYATNWELKRMAVVDRNILRITSFELLFREDIPPK